MCRFAAGRRSLLVVVVVVVVHSRVVQVGSLVVVLVEVGSLEVVLVEDSLHQVDRRIVEEEERRSCGCHMVAVYTVHLAEDPEVQSIRPVEGKRLEAADSLDCVA